MFVVRICHGLALIIKMGPAMEILGADESPSNAYLGMYIYTENTYYLVGMSQNPTSGNRLVMELDTSSIDTVTYR